MMNPEETLEDLQKYLDDNNLTFEEYVRQNIMTDEERKEFNKKWDKLLMDAIYKNLEDN